MSYSEDYIVDNRPDWENSFDYIRVHTDTIKHEGDERILLSYANAQIEFDTSIANNFDTIVLQARDVLGRPLDTNVRNGGQGDFRREDLMIRVNDRHGHRVLEYDPFREVMVVGDIYHAGEYGAGLNQYTEDMRELAQQIEQNYLNYMTVSSDDKLAYVDGQAYRLNEVKLEDIDRTPPMEKVKHMYEEMYSQMKDKIKSGRTFREADARNLATSGISFYSTGEHDYAYKHVSYTVKYVEYSDETGLPLELPKDDWVEDEGTLELKLNGDGNSGINHNISQVRFNTPHPHRQGDTVEDRFSSLCTGSINVGHLESANGLLSYMERLEKSLAKLNMESPYSSIGEYKNYRSNDAYRRFISNGGEHFE